AYLKEKNVQALDYFGYTVAIDGDTIAIGSPGESMCGTGINSSSLDSTCYGSGAAFVYVRNPATGEWWQEAYLKSSNTFEFHKFGTSVAIDGHMLVVGAERENSCSVGIDGEQDNDDCRSGAAYVF